METITSVKNERVKAAAKLTSSAKARREQGLFVLEGLQQRLLRAHHQRLRLACV